MKVLVVNCGSSSLKYQLFDMAGQTCMARGNVERVGTAEAFIVHRPNGGDKVRRDVVARDREQAMKYVFECLVDPRIGVISDLREISAIGHRVVHGGHSLSKPCVIDPAARRAIEAAASFAPLHNPVALRWIDACQSVWGNELRQIAVFDTAFFAQLPEAAWRLSLIHISEPTRPY